VKVSYIFKKKFLTCNGWWTRYNNITSRPTITNANANGVDASEN
jgi:hypothetical protein